MGTREALLGIKRKFVDVPVPEAGETYRLREMSGTERDTFEAGAVVEVEVEVDGEKKTKRQINTQYLRARLVALCLVDDAGVRMFGDDELNQLSDGVPASVLGRLFDAAQKLNGLAAVSVEDAVKN